MNPSKILQCSEFIRKCAKKFSKQNNIIISESHVSNSKISELIKEINSGAFVEEEISPEKQKEFHKNLNKMLHGQHSEN